VHQLTPYCLGYQYDDDDDDDDAAPTSIGRGVHNDQQKAARGNGVKVSSFDQSKRF
jgi:hypothetical protein